jgi:hypothetical protein
MPRKRRAGKERLGELTDAQSWELLLGPRRAGVSAFESEFLRRAAWLQHHDQLLADVNPTTRPWGWWTYEAPGQPLPGETETAALARFGELSAREQALAAAAAAARKGKDPTDAG